MLSYHLKANPNCGTLYVIDTRPRLNAMANKAQVVQLLNINIATYSRAFFSAHRPEETTMNRTNVHTGHLL